LARSLNSVAAGGISRQFGVLTGFPAQADAFNLPMVQTLRPHDGVYVGLSREGLKRSCAFWKWRASTTVIDRSFFLTSGEAYR
jgi:hypothetical protein